MSPSITQTSVLASHGSYMYLGTNLGLVVQIKVTTNPTSGLSSYALRTYVTGTSTISSVGVADDLGSLMVFSNPPSVGLSPGFWTKLPLCEESDYAAGCEADRGSIPARSAAKVRRPR